MVFQTPPENWSMLGGDVDNCGQMEEDGKNFFCQKRYDPEAGRFEDASELNPPEDVPIFCLCCEKTRKKEEVG